MRERLTLRRRDPLRAAYLRLLERNRHLELELTSSLDLVAEQEAEIIRLEDELQTMREEVEKATSGQEDDGTDVPVTGSETCRCGGCVRRRTDHTVRQMTPLHGFHVPWGLG